MPSDVEKRIAEQNHAQRERLAYIDFCLQYRGTIGRNDLIEKFGTGVASCTRDLTLYRDLAGKNLVFRHDVKRYFRTPVFQPLFAHGVEAAMRHLGENLGEDAPALILPPEDLIAAISRAIHLGQVVEMNYLSLSSGQTKRRVVPHSIINNGQRWHVRGYCRTRKEFRDFVCTRITKLTLKEDSSIEPHERVTEDQEWNHHITLVLVPHPDHQHPKGIALDFNMDIAESSPERKIHVRAARAGYLLHHWKVDCSPDHRLPAKEYHLWLRNADAIRQDSVIPLSNMVLAPGWD